MFDRRKIKESFQNSEEFKRLEKNTHNFFEKIKDLPFAERIKTITNKAEEERKKPQEDRFMIYTLLEEKAKNELLEYLQLFEERIKKLESKNN